MNADSMNSEITKILDSENIPSPPSVAARLLELVSCPDVKVNEITDVLSADPKLSAKLIGYCNSPVVSPSRPVTSLQQAVTLLGMRSLRLLSLSFSVMDTRGCDGFPYDDFWRRSLGTAIAAKRLAKFSNRDPDECFLLGLVFDIGMMAIGNVFRDQWRERFGDGCVLDEITEEIELELCGYDRHRIGSCLLRQWNFPDSMIKVLDDYDPECEAEDSVHFAMAKSLGGLMLAETPSCEKIWRAKTQAEKHYRMAPDGFQTLFDQMIADWKGYESLFRVDAITISSISELETRAHESMMQIAMMMDTTIRTMSAEQNELRQLALLDGLTRLKNRHAFDTEIPKVSEYFRRHKKSFGIIVADIDYFKSVNDTHGHAAGDDVLRAVANALTENCRRYDTVYRFGGEEFVIVVADCNDEVARRIAERLRNAIERLEVKIGEKCLNVTISLGICWVSEGQHACVQDIFERADGALYQAKAAGRNRIVAVTPETKADRLCETAEPVG